MMTFHIMMSFIHFDFYLSRTNRLTKSTFVKLISEHSDVDLHHNTVIQVMVMFSTRTICINVMCHQWRTLEFCLGGGSIQQIQLRKEDRERRSGGGRPLPPSQGFWRQLEFGTRNFISYSKRFLIFSTLRLFMMTTSLFVIVNEKQWRTYVVLQFY